MSYPQPQDILSEIRSLTSALVSHGLVDDQNFPFRRSEGSGITTVSYGQSLPGAVAMAAVPYQDLYYEQRAERDFNFLMLDGAMVQMQYEFDGRNLNRARLAFLPSPDLLQYQNNAELYLTDEIMLIEVVDPRVVTVPIRFDYDARANVAVSVHHPVSHLTLGQYANCRIAAVSALTPSAFIDLILRSFYHRPAEPLGLTPSKFRFPRSITAEEQTLVHIGVPSLV